MSLRADACGRNSQLRDVDIEITRDHEPRNDWRSRGGSARAGAIDRDSVAHLRPVIARDNERSRGNVPFRASRMSIDSEYR